MPLSEFLRMARGKLESGEPKQCSTNFSARSEDDLVELVWENGQVMMQGQSSRVARSPTQKVGHGARIGKFGAVESVSNDLSPVVPSGVDFSQDEEVAPWLSYPIDDTLAQDYASPLLPEISGVTASAQNSFVSVDKRSSCEQTVSNLDTMKASSSSSSKSHLLCSWPPQHRQASDVLRSTSNHRGKVFGNTAQGRATVNDCTSLKMGKQSTGQQPINNSNSLNFSHFSRPAALVKPNFPNSDAIPSSRMDVKDKNSSPVSGSNPVKSMRFNSTQKDIDLHVSSPTHAMVSSKQPVFKEITENLCRETSTKNDKPLIPSNTADSIKIVPDGERTIEPMVASSSVGSGNSADRVSCEQTHNSKRKFRDAEESECRSDDIETESFGVKRPTPARGGTGSKRSRAAEVHNLSERRRRDRINEKMRALQELIPNCNKADKASMLDEAIEYLKTLQLQVQIMSMGAGVCMPPMIFPTGMQRMHPAHLPHFSPMGMGMGFGMEMLNMNGGSSGCPIFPVPPMQLAHFPSPMTGPVNFQRIPGPNFPIYAHPGHGFVPRAPLVPLTGQPSMTSSSSLGNGSQNDVPSMSPIVTNTNSPLMRNAEAGSSINHKSNQIQATNAVLDQPAAVRDNKQATDAVGHAALTATTATDISKEPGYD